MTAVSFENVSIIFGDHPDRALPLADQGRSRAEIQAETGQVLGAHDCSLDVAEGEIVVLMGLSGSGKSTLLRAVNGLNAVSRGSVRVTCGDEVTEVTNCSASALRRVRQGHVAMVFQQFGLLPWRTVAENVGFGLELAGQAGAQRAETVTRQLALVGLSDWGDRKVSELSGGMQQRVGLARAFATEAPILLMDEPFSALDPLIRSRLQDELLDLQRELKRTILFVSHDLDEAFKIGNRIAIMEGGRIVQTGTPREIFSAPVSDYVADFVANMNPLGVLTARDVMEPGTGIEEIAAETPIRELMPRLKDGPLTVTEGGRALGRVTADSIVARLAAGTDHHQQRDRPDQRHLISAAPGALEITDVISAADLDTVRELCWEYRDFLLSLRPADAAIVLREYPVETYTELLDRLDVDCRPPGGSVKLVRLHGAPVGCGMVQTLAKGTAEIKRVYLRPEARGTGAGRALMLALIETCRENGSSRILMDTSKPLKAATRLFISLGFRIRGPYTDLPPEVADRMIFFQMDL